MLSAVFAALISYPFLLLRISGDSGSFPKPLTQAQEKEYLEKYAKGDIEARNVLITIYTIAAIGIIIGWILIFTWL